MKYDFVYDSGKAAFEKNYSFKRKDCNSPVSTLCIFFEKEGVCVEVNSDGNAIFSDENGTELYRAKADSKGRCFYKLYCKVKSGVISVRFPIQDVVDHYPHCDGEYDRYSYITKDSVVIDYKP